MHTLMDLNGAIPTFVRLTEAFVHDSKVMDEILVGDGAYYLTDKGSVKFDSLYAHFHQQHAWFVTRAKDNTKHEVFENRESDPQASLIPDETIHLSDYYTARKYPDNLKLVVYEDFRGRKAYKFLTHNFILEAITIAEFYRERWQIEIFFKWIKQHLHLKSFYGTSQNAVYTQIRIAICDYLLIIAKKRHRLKPSIHIISNSIRQILFKRGNIRDFYKKPDIPISVPEGGHRATHFLGKISPDNYGLMKMGEKWADRRVSYNRLYIS